MNNAKKDATVKKFFDLCKKPNFKKAMLFLLPGQIANPLVELMFGNDLEKLIRELEKDVESRQNEIIEKLDELMGLYPFMPFRIENKRPIVALGSGYSEVVVESGDEVTLGNKHTVGLQNLIGGSGANFALRLMAAGHPSIPILPIGNDDAGKYIRQEIINAMVRAKVPDPLQMYIKSDCFLNPKISTPTSIILTGKTKRTIFVQRLHGAEHFHIQLENQFDFVDAICHDHPGSIMIGHVQSDSDSGEATKSVVERYRNRSLIYAVFGNSQLKHGWEFWDKSGVLKEIDVFQLNLQEAQHFLAKKGKRKSLKEILNQFRERKLTAVLTMRRFGALGTFKGSDQLFVAYPLIEGDEVLDTTGAGDAFAAGMVSHLCDNRKFSESDFRDAMKTGQIWASCACKSPGGIGSEPHEELDKFKSEHPHCEESTIEIRSTSSAEDLIRILDLAHQ